MKVVKGTRILTIPETARYPRDYEAMHRHQLGCEVRNGLAENHALRWRERTDPVLGDLVMARTLALNEEEQAALEDFYLRLRALPLPVRRFGPDNRYAPDKWGDEFKEAAWRLFRVLNREGLRDSGCCDDCDDASDPELGGAEAIG